MENLIKMLEYVPFAAMVNGKPKLNTSRVLEILIFMAVMIWYLHSSFEGLSRDMDSIKENQKTFNEHRVLTDQRLYEIEKDLENVQKVVFKPIE